MDNNFIRVLSNYNDNVSRDINDLADQLGRGQFNIVIDQARYPIANLREIFYDNYKLQPSYQRNRVWDKKRKSRLIESLIANVPIPPIFLYETDYNKYEVMDGLQRISTIIEFMNDEFKVEGVESWPELNGYIYTQLPEIIKNSIKRRYLSATIILKETNHGLIIEENIKQFIFERLNTGGMELSPQEVRNALYSGLFNDMLIRAANYSKFQHMTNLSSKSILRMDDRELILRFFAYKSAYKNNIKLGTKELLDLYAKQTRQLSTNEIEDAEDYFYTVLDTIYYLFGRRAFSKTPKSKFERMIYDTLMLSVSEIIDEHGEDMLIRDEASELGIKKFTFFAENKSLFNGKYTAINNVIKRAEDFKSFLIEGLSFE
ncbi:DUF262 domain-containing protein [Niallia taxi]|uniref:DUF262 domain-containing protein n=1 Tax=Niallia taxi TaxID=2499688 RepID=UPI00398207D1